MNTYIGNRLIQAKPMNQQAYDLYRGSWAKPIEGIAAEGYLLEDPKGTANTLSYRGNVSWLPKLQFEANFINLGSLKDKPPHEQRLFGELAQLQEKLSGLLTFTKSEQFLKLNFKQRDLLQEQSRVMTRYVSILEDRIAS